MDPFTVGNLEINNINIKNWPPFDHIILLLEIYPKKQTLRTTQRKYPHFYLQQQKSRNCPKSQKIYIF